MKLPIACPRCIFDGEPGLVFATVEFRDDGRYECTCPKGHSFVALLQNQIFELLFEIGAYAITDGYYREAISSFTSSLERFYEFFVRSVLLHKKINNAFLDSAWKAVNRQSERQLGAFIFLHLFEFGEPPKLLSERDVQIRNDVIHRGKIPTKQQAMEYGQTVLDLIRPTVARLKKDYFEGTWGVVSHNLTRSDKGPIKSNMQTSIPTILDLSRDGGNLHTRSLEQAIAELSR